MPSAAIRPYYSYTRLLKRQLKDDKKVVLERNKYKRKVHQLQSVCKKQFVLSLVSPMYIVMSFRCVLRNSSGEIKKMLISYPVEKLVRKERKRRRILYMRWSVYWKLFRRELRWLTSPWRKGFLLPSKSWKQLQNKETTGLQIKISTASCVSWIRILLNNAKQQAARPAVVCFYVLHPLPYCC